MKHFLKQILGKSNKTDLIIFDASAQRLMWQKRKYSWLEKYNVTAVLVTDPDLRAACSHPDMPDGELGGVDPLRVELFPNAHLKRGMEAVDYIVSDIHQVKQLMMQVRPKLLLTYDHPRPGKHEVISGYDIISAARRIITRIPAAMEARSLSGERNQRPFPQKPPVHAFVGDGRYWQVPLGGLHADEYFKRKIAESQRRSAA